MTTDGWIDAGPATAENPPAPWKRVRDLYVGCSLKVRNLDEPGFALSDCCQRHAISVVVMEGGERMYRCDVHEGIRRIVRGPVETNVRINA